MKNAKKIIPLPYDHTCTHEKSGPQYSYWGHHQNHQDNGHAPSRLQIHIGSCKSLIQKCDQMHSLAPL